MNDDSFMLLLASLILPVKVFRPGKDYPAGPRIRAAHMQAEGLQTQKQPGGKQESKQSPMNARFTLTNT
jgi:hypothetical protein